MSTLFTYYSIENRTYLNESECLRYPLMSLTGYTGVLNLVTWPTCPDSGWYTCGGANLTLLPMLHGEWGIFYSFTSNIV